ncbi:MAG TPA: 23S rRNA (adenine(2503)-C(2))-methyltransferase RlmN [Polyangiaceae bacterium]|nr:23S rRNA (adenine(2503)-C(2))-methyltransferase RlmN [Polyangiaceae bacterium]
MSDVSTSPSPTLATNLEALGRFPEEWEATLSAQGQPKYRAKQVFRWLHNKGVYAPAAMTDLSAGLRSHLESEGLGEPFRVAVVKRSSDTTRKLLLELSGGGNVECVLIPMTKQVSDADAAAAVEDEEDVDAAPEKTKVTLCISTQFGCAMGCKFCASGRAGLIRGLRAAEVAAQVLVAKRYVEPHEDLRNLVFMGMGEPLHHYDETARALRLLMHPDGLGMSPRRITVSTVGLVPGIHKLGRDFDGKIGLAVSLHAPNDQLRSQIMPMNDRYPIADLMQALQDYPLPRRRRITIEYTLIGGVNDAIEHARELANLLRRLPVKINLIPMNPVANSGFAAPEPARVAAFQAELARQGYSCFIRARRGDDVDAACGQLALASDLVGRSRLARASEKPSS